MDSAVIEQLIFKITEHAYSFQLNWDKMKPLINNLFEVWEDTKNSIENFIKSST